MNILKKIHKNFHNMIRYSDTDLLEFVMNMVIIVLNPLIFSSIDASYPMWLVFMGIPFGLFSIYKLLQKCSSGRDLSYLLTIGQLLGIMILVYQRKSLFYPLFFELLIFSFLRWRTAVDVKRKNKRSAKC